MPKKQIAKDSIADEGARNIIKYLEGWALKTSKDQTDAFERKLWDNALNPSAVNYLIDFISKLESASEELNRAEEHIRRLERSCYGKCPHYEHRT